MPWAFSLQRTCICLSIRLYKSLRPRHSSFYVLRRFRLSDYGIRETFYAYGPPDDRFPFVHHMQGQRHRKEHRHKIRRGICEHSRQWPHEHEKKCKVSINRNPRKECAKCFPCSLAPVRCKIEKRALHLHNTP